MIPLSALSMRQAPLRWIRLLISPWPAPTRRAAQTFVISFQTLFLQKQNSLVGLLVAFSFMGCRNSFYTMTFRHDQRWWGRGSRSRADGIHRRCICSAAPTSPCPGWGIAHISRSTLAGTGSPAASNPGNLSHGSWASLVVQWLRLRTSTGGVGSIPGQGTQLPHAGVEVGGMWWSWGHGQKQTNSPLFSRAMAPPVRRGFDELLSHRQQLVASAKVAVNQVHDPGSNGSLEHSRQSGTFCQMTPTLRSTRVSVDEHMPLRREKAMLLSTQRLPQEEFSVLLNFALINRNLKRKQHFIVIEQLSWIRCVKYVIFFCLLCTDF